MDKIKLIEKVKKFPDSPGVYIMRDVAGRELYIGKASSLRRRVISYFQRPQEARIEKMLTQVDKIETKGTDSVLEALLLENELIKKIQPKYNIKLKDDKTYLGIFITKEEWPRVMPARITEKLPAGDFYGPYAGSNDVREALQIIRKIFPFRYACEPNSGKACFEYHMGLCPGVCAGKVDHKEYLSTIKQIRLFMNGKKKSVIKEIEKQMKISAKNLEYEKAAKLRDRVFALRHISDAAIITEADINPMNDIPPRIEAYDVSNIAGEFAVGSMVVFTEGLIDKSNYRKFKIKSVKGANDVAMMQEVLKRRFTHDEWASPDLILVDGGRPQINAVEEVLIGLKKDIPVIGIAKGPDRKKDEIIASKKIPTDKRLLLKIRDEAHRFAITYYRTLHRKSLR